LAEAEAEEDAFNKLDKQNDMLEKQLKKELEKENAHLAKEKKKWKDQ
jgi:ribosome-associated translation inhibitor RaiA